MIFERLRQLIIAKENPSTLKQSLRTAVAAVVSLFVARLFRLPETYWAAISTLIVMQSNLGTTLPFSAQHFIGTALGAILGGFIATYFHTNIVAFGAAVFAVGVVCTLLKLERAAYRYASVTLAIVMLVPRAGSEWVIARHRFSEVSIGIVVGLGLSAAWPERTNQPSEKIDDSISDPGAVEGI